MKLTCVLFGFAHARIEHYLDCVRQMENPMMSFQRDCASFAFDGADPPRPSDYAARYRRSTYEMFKGGKNHDQCKPIKCAREPHFIDIDIFQRSGYRIGRENKNIIGNKIDIGRCVGYCQKTPNTFRDNFTPTYSGAQITSGCAATKTASIFVNGRLGLDELTAAITLECSCKNFQIC
ncbi:Oidioi.mRNA.OKI2018_I69.PAR.g10226.t1.cds [Oikopleura dioica]|uniref:Oidioi.mRNA.OKI2018_I69.PAR.g10226.t1.cds n=1 Tax=Oikopleura dioica TaxID=34765 RepID=A0ABN7RTY9_OIKDI|nr:Oidioi.mRNA.OKI2018_I69.PAR.g10226.t1.cds [Oikopleura dioica]